jgi:osmotically-inducible protein OsmY
MNRITRFSTCAASALLAALCVGCMTDRTKDEAITSRVNSGIAEHPELIGTNAIRIQTINGTVYLYGHVDTPTERQLAESIASNTPEVRSVVDSVRLSNPGG